MINNIFKQTCVNHYFELQVAKAIKSKHIKTPVYLSIGTEHVAATLATRDWIVFPQHRCHSYYLSFGGNPEKLALELLGSKEGCNGGMAGSASISNEKMFGHDGLLGSQVPIAVGYCQASKSRTLCIAGDAAIEEDYSLGAIAFLAGKKLPILIVVEDNDLSILTKKSVRRSWDIVKVARGFGIDAMQISDHPTEILLAMDKISLPGLININVCRHYWHSGAGVDNTPEWDRFEQLRQGREKVASEIEKQMEELWQPLLKQSEK